MRDFKKSLGEAQRQCDNNNNNIKHFYSAYYVPDTVLSISYTSTI